MDTETENLILSAITERIGQAVERSGLTKAQVAQRLGVTAGALAQWCSGETRPSVKNLALLAYVTGVKIGYLFGEDEDGVLPIIRQEAENWRRVKDMLNREGLLTDEETSPKGERKTGTRGNDDEGGAFLYQTGVRSLVPSGNENLSRRPSSDRLCGAAS